MDKTMNMQGRCDIRHVAAIAKHFINNGVVPTKSNIVGNALAVAALMFERAGKTNIPQSTEAAWEYLEKIGLKVVTQRGVKVLAEAVIKEAENDNIIEEIVDKNLSQIQDIDINAIKKEME